MSVFEFSDYKAFLNHMVLAGGYSRTALAKAAKCQRPYISNVLNGGPQISMDQAIELASSLGLDPLETDYFTNLVAYERAGTQNGRRYYEAKLSQLREEAYEISKKIDSKVSGVELFDEYYIDWRYAMVHMATTIDALQTEEGLSHCLNIPRVQLAKVLKRLEEYDCVKKVDNVWKPGRLAVHLKKGSPLNFVNHRTRRDYALARAQVDPGASINYSAIYTIHSKDVKKFKDLVMAAIRSSRELVQETEDAEVPVIFNVDFVANFS